MKKNKMKKKKAIKMMKKTGFTLIELLLFITVIAILASVGVVAYIGYTGAAKVSATKTIHAQTVKFISAEVAKCELDKTSIVYGNLSCSSLSPNSLALAASKNSTFFLPNELVGLSGAVGSIKEIIKTSGGK